MKSVNEREVEGQVEGQADGRRVIAKDPWSERYLVSNHGALNGPEFWGLDISGPQGYVVDMEFKGGLRCRDFSLCAILARGMWIPAELSEAEERSILNVR